MSDLPQSATLVVAALAAATAALLVPSRPRARLPLRSSAGQVRDGGDDDDALTRYHLAVCVLAGLAPVLLVGGWWGAVAGVVVAVTVHRTLLRREPATVRRRREQLARALPQTVELLGVALAAGAAPAGALAAVAAAVDEPMSTELASVRHALDLGRDPVQVWRELARRPGMAVLGRTMARAVETGASVSGALHRLADDLVDAARLETESRARSVGVRAAAPLGLCLLPAFVLVGVVPLVAGAVGSLLAP